MNLKTTKLSIDAFVTNDKGSAIQPISFDQNIEFSFDENMKGHQVGMKLTSKRFIDAPDHTIYIKNDQLKKILEFLIESEK